MNFRFATILCLCLTLRVTAAVNFFAWGDWGFDGNDRQTVADTMAKYARTLPEKPDCALLLGDNFRVKLKNADDPMFKKLFEKTYDKKILDFPFYAALGNHDYEQNKTSIELSYAKSHPGTRWHMPAKWYRLDLPQDKPLVTILMLDSDQQAMSPDEWSAEAQWIESQLQSPRAPWTICAAHHTIFSNGAHGDNGVLQTEWGPLFKKYHVDFYACGHDHSLQHLEIPNWPISFVIAGGGGAGRKPMLRDLRGPFSKAEMGFAHFSFDADSATVRFLDGTTGHVVHAFTRDHAGKVTVLSNTPSDRATTKPLRVIQGIDEKAKKSKANED